MMQPEIALMLAAHNLYGEIYLVNKADYVKVAPYFFGLIISPLIVQITSANSNLAKVASFSFFFLLVNGLHSLHQLTFGSEVVISVGLF